MTEQERDALREQRRRELQAMRRADVIAVYHSVCGVPEGMKQPGTAYITEILKAEFPDDQVRS